MKEVIAVDDKAGVADLIISPVTEAAPSILLLAPYIWTPSKGIAEK